MPPLKTPKQASYIPYALPYYQGKIDENFDKVVAMSRMANERNIDPEKAAALFGHMTGETGGTFDPKITPPKGHVQYTGLVQVDKPRFKIMSALMKQADKKANPTDFTQQAGYILDTFVTKHPQNTKYNWGRRDNQAIFMNSNEEIPETVRLLNDTYVRSGAVAKYPAKLLERQRSAQYIADKLRMVDWPQNIKVDWKQYATGNEPPLPLPNMTKKPTSKLIPKNKKGGKSKNWIQGAVDPAHKGDCTPMTKTTCTPRRKAFAMTMKKHHGFHKKDGGIINYDISKILATWKTSISE